MDVQSSILDNLKHCEHCKMEIIILYIKVVPVETECVLYVHYIN